MKVLVTGANGMLGQDLCPTLEDAGYEVIETDIHNLDITNEKMVEDVNVLNDKIMQNLPRRRVACRAKFRLVHFRRNFSRRTFASGSKL